MWTADSSKSGELQSIRRSCRKVSLEGRTRRFIRLGFQPDKKGGHNECNNQKAGKAC